MAPHICFITYAWKATLKQGNCRSLLVAFAKIKWKACVHKVRQKQNWINVEKAGETHRS